MRIDTPILVGLAFATVAAGLAHAQEVPASLTEPLVVFLVRHADRADGSANSELSADGSERAVELANTLRDAKIAHVHSTDFIRTMATAMPAATAHGLQIRAYDPSDLASVAATIRSLGGRHLVVGHSDTTPALVDLLGGDPGPAIDEGEFDRLYVITVADDGITSTVMIRYGVPYTPP